MADIAALVSQLMTDGTVKTLAINTGAQFGIAPRTYLGASLLPERLVDENAYREEAIRYRTVIANDGTRYSPSQKKGAEILGSFLVELGNIDITTEFTARAYDALLRMLGSNITMDAAASLIDWLDKTVNLALAEKNEKQRWEAIVSASVVRTGDNAYTETVPYSNPASHRSAAAGTWSSDAYDPFDDILAKADLLASKGYTVGRIIAGRTVVSLLSGNDKVKARTGVATISATGQIQSTAGRASTDAINNALNRDGLPPIEQYDLQYRTQTGTGYFLSRSAFVMVATTGQDETLDYGDTARIVNDTLGYVGMGRAAGQATAGRVLRMESHQDKPPRVIGEGWQTSLPVITAPEAITVITGIA
ncbi:MAG: major capsid protein [Chloroflexota bacterium]|nr:major capsid protein [Chloroflexota bacterium]